MSDARSPVLHTLAWDTLLPPPEDVAHTEDCPGCEIERLELALTRAMDRGNAYEMALERIGWHELTWKEARDVAREALGSPIRPQMVEVEPYFHEDGTPGVREVDG